MFPLFRLKIAILAVVWAILLLNALPIVQDASPLSHSFFQTHSHIFPGLICPLTAIAVTHVAALATLRVTALKSQQQLLENCVTTAENLDTLQRTANNHKPAELAAALNTWREIARSRPQVLKLSNRIFIRIKHMFPLRKCWPLCS